MWIFGLQTEFNVVFKEVATYRCRFWVDPGVSALPRDPSRSTLCLSGSLNGLRGPLLRVASNGRYIGAMYGVKLLLNPELLGFINESHSCFIVFNGSAEGELFLWCLRSCSWDCDCAAAKRPCSVDKPLTCTSKYDVVKQKQNINRIKVITKQYFALYDIRMCWHLLEGFQPPLESCSVPLVTHAPLPCT